MKAVLQRVKEASVAVAGATIASIGAGWLVLLGVSGSDSEQDADFIADKILSLRGFADADGKMNLSVQDRGGAILVISQFTLYGDCRKGRRPSFGQAAKGEAAKALYEHLLTTLRASTLEIAQGQFGADMQVALINDGPVTLIVDSPDRPRPSSEQQQQR